MIKSMTGYGKITNTYENFDITVELKSVNSKYLDPSFRMSKSLNALEISLRNTLQELLVRGKIDIRIDLNMNVSQKMPILNNELLISYKAILDEIVTKTGISDSVKLEHILRAPELIEYRTNEDGEEELHRCVLETFKMCIAKLDEMRIAEGVAMRNDIVSNLAILRENVIKISDARIDVFTFWREKFTKRLNELGVNEINEERIVHEATVYGEKADISEELTRLNSHTEQFEKIVTTEFPIGKKLDFLSQEIHRELNTIASKSSRAEIISTVVESKAIADRIREQVQNII